MTDALILIATRRRVVTNILAEHRKQIAALEAEISDLDAAERVLRSLSPLEVSARVADSSPSPLTSVGLVEGGPELADQSLSMPEMIEMALKKNRAEGGRGLEPKGIHAEIIAEIWPGARPEAVSSITWRMWKRGQLEKVGSLYRLPETREASDTLPYPGLSEASEAARHLDAEGREAGPGGGT